MKREKKQKMLNATALAFIKGILPKNLNEIAPDYVYFMDKGRYVNVFLSKPISHEIVSLEVFSIKNSETLEKAHKAVSVLNGKYSDSRIVYQTLIDTQYDEIVGVIVSNIQIVP